MIKVEAIDNAKNIYLNIVKIIQINIEQPIWLITRFAVKDYSQSHALFAVIAILMGTMMTI